MSTVFLCPRCRTILGRNLQHDGPKSPHCPTCHVRFVPQDCDYCAGKPVGERPCHELPAFLRDWWSAVDVPDGEEHRERLLEAGELVAGRGNGTGTELTGLFRALAGARGFVHFTSWGMSHLLLGALKLLSEQDVQVTGIVSGAFPDTLLETTAHAKRESLWLDVVSIPRETSAGAPHQKLIVIDGLIAFKGSANLTTNAWRKASEQHEIVEVVTSLAEIARLHNLYFSKAWLRWGRNRFMQTGDIIRMDHI